MAEKLKGIAYMRAMFTAHPDDVALVAQDIKVSASALTQFAAGGDLPADKLDLLGRHRTFGWRKYDPITDEMVSARDEPIEKLSMLMMEPIELEPMVVLPFEATVLVTLREGTPPPGGVGSSAQDREEQRRTQWAPGMLRTA